jgi:FtsH-binding integral membrane protein
MSTYRGYAAPPAARSLSQSRAVFGQVMGLVAVTVGFTSLGAYLGRNTTSGVGIGSLIAAFACIFGLNFAVRRGAQQVAVALLFGLGLLLGFTAGPLLNAYAQAEPTALYQAAGSTAVFVAGLGAYGYATRRDLSGWARGLFWMLLALIAFGLVTLFVSIPGGNVIYSLLGLGVFGAFTIFDFNRLRRSTMDDAVLIAASIFLDIFNVFLFMLQLFGGGGRR